MPGIRDTSPDVPRRGLRAEHVRAAIIGRMSLYRRFNWFAVFAGAVCLSIVSMPAAASALERFQAFLASTQSGRAQFDQKVRDRNGKVLQDSKGQLAFARPGRFRWAYEKPYAQLIVGDGARVWVYDQDLKQVTVRRIGEALTSTPAALLAGNNEALRAFTLSEGGVREGLEWLHAVPKDKEGGFETVRIGLGVAGPEAMELADTFGNLTVLRLRNFERNPALDSGLFRFTPPPGADVIGEPGK